MLSSSSFRWKILLSFPHHSYDTTLVRRLKCEIRPQDSIYRFSFHTFKKIGREKLRNKSTFRCGIIFQPFLSGAGFVNGRQMYLQVSDSDVSSSAHPYFSLFLPSPSPAQRRFLKKNGHLQSSVAQISQTGYRDESFRPLSNPGAEESFILGIHPLLSFIYARRKCFVFIFPLSFFVN